MIYAIRNKSDPSIFFHLPRRSTGNVRGLTKIERFEPGRVPRLFQRKSHARIALWSWVRASMKERATFEWEIIPIKIVEARDDETKS